MWNWIKSKLPFFKDKEEEIIPDLTNVTDFFNKLYNGEKYGLILLFILFIYFLVRPISVRRLGKNINAAIDKHFPMVKDLGPDDEYYGPVQANRDTEPIVLG
tara:strand:+ start:1997 stop:2302 length:306 start_codon:yes stop_codon:yes gene_type:complete